MPYICRNASNKTPSVPRWPDGSEEFLPEGHPDVAGYRNRPPLHGRAAKVVAGIEAAERYYFAFRNLFPAT